MNSLHHTAAGLSATPDLVQHDIVEPLGGDIEPFDSISINYVFHCLPGNWESNRTVIANLATHLRPSGVLFGSTILGVDQRFSLFGKFLMAVYNRIRAFDNRHDDLQGLTEALESSFTDVVVRMVGNVAIFVAARPIRTRGQ